MAMDKVPTTISRVVKEAQERFELCNKREAYARRLYDEDFRFANGDADNGYQWNNEDRNARAGDRRPCLTINKVRQHNFNIINEAKQNKPAIKYMATGNGATYEAAQIWMALARRIEAYSDASEVYSTATDHMVQGGFGYGRMATEYVAENSFLQQLRLVRIPDPLKVFIDPDATERDKSDMRFGFIYHDMDRKEFDREYPDLADAAKMGGAIVPGSWINDQYVRTAEYFRVESEDDTLWQVFSEEEGVPPLIAFESETPKDLIKEWKSTPALARSRPTKRKKVVWSYIVGDEEVETNIWPGKYIPIIPFIAEEVVIDGKIDRKSHTRALKDPQRMYNWWSSAAVEYGALQTKTPWIAAAESIDGLENLWNNANRQNKSVLIYNAFNEEGEPIPPPQRVEPPVAAPVALTGMEVASREMAMVSGQYESQMGAPSNERSGKAINERQRMGDRSTYHYIDATAIAIKLVGKIILDTVPRIYEPEQVVQILAEDGQSLDIKIDPGAQKAFEAIQNENGEVITRILNPTIGQYDVVADVGPGYATRREETFNALVLLLTQAPQLAGVIGDLLFRSGDFMFADEAAERLRRMVPPQALGQGPTQNEQMLMQQLEELKKLLAKTMEENAGARIRAKGRDEKRDIDVYKAFTERLKVLQDAGMSQQDHALATVQLMRDMMNDDLEATQDSVDSSLKSRTAQGSGQMQLPLQGGGQPAPMQGARLAPDGHHYVPDPMRPGKFMRVMMEGLPGGQG